MPLEFSQERQNFSWSFFISKTSRRHKSRLLLSSGSTRTRLTMCAAQIKLKGSEVNVDSLQSAPCPAHAFLGNKPAKRTILLLCHIIYTKVFDYYYAWKIPWTEEPGRLQSRGSLRVGHDWATSLSLFISCIGEGNGNPLQYSCLENPKDGWAWWTAVYGVAQSRTRLKRLSSSSSSKLWITLLCSVSRNLYNCDLTSNGKTVLGAFWDAVLGL